MNFWQIFYVALSIAVIAFVIVYGVASKSNYMPSEEPEEEQGKKAKEGTAYKKEDKKNDQKKPGEGGMSNVSTN
jgi:phosphotransferase system  glucose/maltose/N-acetylglucosamine-specific IIC component